MNGTDGTNSVTATFATPKAGRIPIAIIPARRTWTTTATGSTLPATVTCGSLMRAGTGCPTATVAGSGTPITAGHGFPTSRGVGRRTTTVAGSIITMRGLGGPARSIRLIVPSGRPPLFRSSVLGDTQGSGSASD